jgi:hypothetical protein
VEQSDPGPTEGCGKQETPSAPESPLINEGSASTPDEAPQELNTSAVTEIAEQTDVSEASAKPEVSDSIEVTKEMTATVINDEPDAANTPDTSKILDEAEALESAEANESESSAVRWNSRQLRLWQRAKYLKKLRYQKTKYRQSL